MLKLIPMVLLLMIIAEVAGVYFIMPLPGSQKWNSVAFAYWHHQNVFWIRLILVSLLGALVYLTIKKWRWIFATSFVVLLGLYITVFYFTNYKMRADKMFVQLRQKNFLTSEKNTVPTDKLVVGVVADGVAKAYPIQYIGYHHQVRDTVGNTPVMVTYCTVCRTGRVFSPVVDGKTEDFRLVGMDHFNAMFEDGTTKSWWQQATGTAVTGKQQGKQLAELPSQQSTLSSWLARYPNSLILQPDTTFNKRYKGLKDFDSGTTDDELEKRDSASWQFKSWVIGVDRKGTSKAYDWNTLASKKFISDSLADLPLIITLEPDTATFHVLNRLNKGRSLQFELIDDKHMRDLETGSVWTYDGKCEEGELKGERLATIQASQEFWHSWQTFHPKTAMHR